MSMKIDEKQVLLHDNARAACKHWYIHSHSLDPPDDYYVFSYLKKDLEIILFF